MINKKSDKTFRSSIFRVMEPVHRLIALWGSPQGGGRGTAEAPRSVITMEWKILLRVILRKNQGLK